MHAEQGTSLMYAYNDSRHSYCTYINLPAPDPAQNRRELSVYLGVSDCHLKEYPHTMSKCVRSDEPLQMEIPSWFPSEKSWAGLVL